MLYIYICILILCVYTYVYNGRKWFGQSGVLETNMMLQHGLLQIDLICGSPAHEQHQAAAA